jgi:hypothetical protein
VFAVESIYDVAVRNLLSEESCLKMICRLFAGGSRGGNGAMKSPHVNGRMCCFRFLNQTEDELSRASLAAESFYPLDIFREQRCAVVVEKALEKVFQVVGVLAKRFT